MGTASSRRTAVVVLGSLALIVLLFLVAENAFNLKFLSPENSGSILLFTALSGLSFLLFLVLLVLLLRNILKLYATGQSRVLGSRLRTRMLVGALLLSAVPAFFMLAFNYLLMNRSVDRWFSQPVVRLRDQSVQLAVEMSRYASDNVRAEAESLAHEPEMVSSSLPAHPQALLRLYRRHKVTLQGGFVVVYRDDHAIDQYELPGGAASSSLLSSIQPNEQAEEKPAGTSLTDYILQAARRSDDPILKIGQTAYSV
ncbi:MAG: nitrogen regulation protein NtrY, partial [Acidobacteriaceae bacterium]